MESLTLLLLSLTGSFFGVTDTANLNSREDGVVLLEDEYKCDAHVWKQEPKMVSGNLEAVISAECVFLGKGGGGHTQLEEALRVRIEKEAVKIHSGPTEELYNELPSNYYDATFLFESTNGDKANVRQDIHVASNKADQTMFDSFSKEVKASGNFKYLKKLDILSTVLNTETPQWYKIKLESAFKLDKPAFVPKSYFIKEVTKMIEAEIPKTEKQLISEMAPNI